MANKNLPEAIKYDVAISFCTEDEILATELAEELRQHGTVFVYTEQQRQLAGKDGVKTLTAVFKEESRLCLVLFREGWGDAGWTGIEAAAIRDHALRESWDILFVGRLDEAPLPSWMPESKIWVDVRKSGVGGVRDAIVARLEESGRTTAVVEAMRDRARRLAREARRRAEQQAFLDSYAGVEAAEAAVQQMKRMMRLEVSAIRDEGTNFSFMEDRDRAVFGVRGLRASVVVGWWSYRNTTSGSSLLISEFEGAYAFDGMHDASVTRRDPFRFSVDHSDEPAWTADSERGRSYSTKQLVDRCLGRLLDAEYDSID